LLNHLFIYLIFILIMKNLSTTGLSMSQAQSISNLCNQRALEIQRELDSYNVCSKSIKVSGESYSLVDAYPMPSSVIELLREKGRLHATQAFLMEATKSKNAELERLQYTSFDASHIVRPQFPDIDEPFILTNVSESWGWTQLTANEYSEYLEAEAFASHLGQFIHKNGKLSGMRSDVANLPSIEWMTVKDGEKTPVKINKHHSSIELLNIHEQIASAHRVYEQRVNYFKAKVKNLVSDENARIQKVNSDLWAQYDALMDRESEIRSKAFESYRNQVQKETADFNAAREQQIKDTAALRISVDPRFQHVIDTFITAE
jgi:hypothetical protein